MFYYALKEQHESHVFASSLTAKNRKRANWLLLKYLCTVAIYAMITRVLKCSFIYSFALLYNANDDMNNDKSYIGTAEKDMKTWLIIAVIHTTWSFIYSFALFTFYGYITDSQCDQLPDGWNAQLVEHCTGIAEVTGFESGCQALYHN